MSYAVAFTAPVWLAAGCAFIEGVGLLAMRGVWWVSDLFDSKEGRDAR